MNLFAKYCLFFLLIACFFQAKAQEKGRATYWVTEQKYPYHFIYPVFDAKDENKLYYVTESANYEMQFLCAYNLENHAIDSVGEFGITQQMSVNRNNQMIAPTNSGFLQINLNKKDDYTIDKRQYSRVTWVSDSLFAYITREILPDGRQGKNILKIITQNGILLDTLYHFLPYYTGINGNSRGLIAYSHKLNTENQGELQFMSYLDVYKHKIITFFISEKYTQTPTHLAWNPVNLQEIYWVCQEGVFKTNIETMETENIILSHNPSFYYERISVSADGKKLAVQILEREMKGYITYESQNIYVIDLQEKVEKKLPL